MRRPTGDMKHKQTKRLRREAEEARAAAKRAAEAERCEAQRRAQEIREEVRRAAVAAQQEAICQQQLAVEENRHAAERGPACHGPTEETATKRVLQWKRRRRSSASSAKASSLSSCPLLQTSKTPNARSGTATSYTTLL
ncbi:hypothetical protein GGX14DRAFT_575161 [Mycena pura]|uniref:Uncharacterized protein n=1 Tax=Mycena pura TaxID=153505 RepID=A0AAD6UVL9_9AGAR|nr:hypothetical protein GGX14DRAFT_575161 [Mycena pura]